MTEAPEKYVGGGVPRKEDPALVTGRANWTDNIKLPGMLHMAVLRSPFAHAKITHLDVSGALEQPGVVAAFTGEDFAREWGAGAGEAEQAPGYALLIDELPGGEGEVTETEESSLAGLPLAHPLTPILAAHRPVGYILLAGRPLLSTEDTEPPVTKIYTVQRGLRR